MDIQSYKIPDEVIVSNTACQLKLLIEFRDFLINNGINAIQSRISKYIRFLQNLYEDSQTNPLKIFKEPHDDRFHSIDDWFTYTLREVHELLWIFRAIQISAPIGVFDKLKLVNAGRDFAAFDTNSTSRDTQFELRIASYFCNPNLKVDVSSETDIIIEFDKFFLYIECKRIQSEKQIMSNLYKANEQLKTRLPHKRSGKPCYGIIAIDVTAVAYPHQGMVYGITSEHARDEIRAKIKAISNKINYDNIFSKNSKLLAIWTNIHIPAIRMQPPGHETRFTYLMYLKDSNDRKETQALLKIKHTAEDTIDESEQDIKTQKLTIRKKLTIPKGLTFQFNEDIINEYFSNQDEIKQNWHQKGAICTAKYNDDTIDFSIIEFSNALIQLTGDNITELDIWKNKSSEIFLNMLFFKFPYEEIGPKWLSNSTEL